METWADDEGRTAPEGLGVLRVQERVGRREGGGTAADEEGDTLITADEDAGITADEDTGTMDDEAAEIMGEEDAETTAEEDDTEITAGDEGRGVGVGVGVGTVEKEVVQTLVGPVTSKLSQPMYHSDTA